MKLRYLKNRFEHLLFTYCQSIAPFVYILLNIGVTLALLSLYVIAIVFSSLWFLIFLPLEIMLVLAFLVGIRRYLEYCRNDFTTIPFDWEEWKYRIEDREFQKKLREEIIQLRKENQTLKLMTIIKIL